MNRRIDPPRLEPPPIGGGAGPSPRRMSMSSPGPSPPVPRPFASWCLPPAAAPFRRPPPAGPFRRTALGCDRASSARPAHQGQHLSLEPAVVPRQMANAGIAARGSHRGPIPISWISIIRPAPGPNVVALHGRELGLAAAEVGAPITREIRQGRYVVPADSSGPIGSGATPAFRSGCRRRRRRLRRRSSVEGHPRCPRLGIGPARPSLRASTTEGWRAAQPAATAAKPHKQKPANRIRNPPGPLEDRVYTNQTRDGVGGRNADPIRVNRRMKAPS